MNYTELVTTYGPTILDAANTMREYFIPSEKKNSNRTNVTWIDPICAMIALTILNKEPEGTKLSFHNNTISFNQPGIFQFIVRHQQGSSRNDLYNLIPAIYYSVKWLNLAENSKYEIIFKMAKDGISRMINGTYHDDLGTQHYLTTTHLKMLNDALEKKTILREDFMVPNHDKNPLNEHSYSIWIKTKTYLDELPQLLLDFEKNPEVIKDQLTSKIRNIEKMHKDYLDAMREGRSAPSEEQTFEFESITLKIAGNGTPKDT